MSRPSGNLHPRGPSGHEAKGAPRRTESGIARGPGLLVAAVTAAIVFVIGMQVWPVKPKQVEQPPAPAPVAPAEPPATADGGSAAADAAGAADAGAGVAAASADAGKAGAADQEPAAEKTPPGEPTDESAADLARAQARRQAEAG